VELKAGLLRSLAALNRLFVGSKVRAVYLPEKRKIEEYVPDLGYVR
jgi:hypothetical protein